MSIYLYLVTIALMGILTQLYFRLRNGYEDNLKALFVKASCTFIPVLLVFYALFLKGFPFSGWLLFVGVFICMVADFAIGIRFNVGVSVFLVAQISFIAYYLTLMAFQPASLIIFAMIALCAAVLFHRNLSIHDRKMALYILYASALMLMVSVALILPFTVKNPGAVCIATGAVLFIISDSLLAKNTFNSPDKLRDRLVMYLYYPAVYLIAVSAFYIL